MRTPVRIAAFAVAAVAVFGAAALAGAALDPLREGGDAHGHGQEGHGEDHGAEAPAELRLEATRTVLPRGRAAEWGFRVADAAGAPVTAYDVTHERRMHLIVVRQDLSVFRHLHPVLGADGTWRARVDLPDAGAYRAFADFSAGGTPHTLETDLQVPGPFAPRPLPAPRAQASDGAYTATLTAGGLVAGRPATLSYALARGGRPLDGVDPYLGADGHLVALREGDLEFLHVHPEEGGGPGVVRFGATPPSPGRYRLFMQFAHGGAVRTVAHTIEVPR
ncbi:MAG: hypothetical protein AB7V62_11725 [Thermoleophilia bacterium]